MTVLVDTSVLMRLADVTDPDYRVAGRAVAELYLQGETLCVTPQNFVEFRNAATRPRKVNGLGLTAVEVERKAAIWEASFGLLPDTPDIYPAWKALVSALGVVGKTVHDARLVAVCHAHAVDRILTFNVAHFARLTGYGPAVAVLDPAAV